MKKSVRISEDKNQVHVLVKWDFAYRQARKCDYQRNYLDRLRFERRIMQCQNILHNIFDEEHRNKIYAERFNVIDYLN